MKKILLVSVSIVLISVAIFLTSSKITAKSGEIISNANGHRPQIIKITVELSNGETHQIDPKKSVAMFWGYNTAPGTTSEPAASAILGAFYDNFNVNITMTRAKYSKIFGKRRTDVAFPEASEKIILNKELIRKLWETPDESGRLTPYIVKKPDCDFGKE